MAVNVGYFSIENTFDALAKPPLYLFSLSRSPELPAMAVSIDSPAPSAVVQEGTTIRITGTLSMLASSVVVKFGSTVLGSATLAGTSWYFDYALLPGDAGAQTLNATATALAGGSTANAAGVAITVFAPNSIANLAIEMSALASAFTDTGGTTVAAPPGGRVRRSDQPSPLTGSWLAASDPVRPFKEAAAIDFHGGNSMNFAVPVGTTLVANATTLAFTFTPRDNPPGDLQSPFLGNDTVGAWGIALFSANTLYIYREGGGSWATGVSIPAGTTFSGVVRFSPSGLTLDYKLGSGAITRITQSVSISTRTVSSLRLGSGDSQFSKNFHGAIPRFNAYSRTLNDTEAGQALANMIANAAPAGYPADCPLLMVTGDSIARGLAVSQPQTWGFLMLPNLYATAPVKMRNTAISGYSIANVAADYAANVAPYYSASRAKNILFAAFGTNSLAFNPAGQYTTFLSDYLAYCDMVRAAGWKVIAQTILPRTDAISNASFDADRLAYNIALRAASSRYDALADVALISGMSTASDSTGANFQADHVHPTPAGHVLIEAVQRTQTITLLAA